MPIDTRMILEILQRTPSWVWALLAALLALGASQLRTRRVPRRRLWLLPLALTVLGLVSTATSLAPAAPALAAWAAACVAGIGLGRRVPPPPGARWDAARSALLLPGSALPLLLMVALFLLRYVGSVSLLLHPQWRGDLSVALPMAAAYGGLAGTWLGRLLGLLRRAPAEQAPA